jgi:hypothetical protein
MKTTKAVTMEAPIPVYSAVLLSSEFAETVRRNTCMCITVSEIRYQTWEEIYDEIIIITS